MGCRWGRTDRGSRVAGAEGKVNDPFHTSVSSYICLKFSIITFLKISL